MTLRTLLALPILSLLALACAAGATAAPPLPPNAPDLVPSSDSGSSASDNITNDQTPDFTVDAGAANAGMTVTVYFDDNDGNPDSSAVGTAIVPASGIASVTSTPIADDTYTVTATLTNLSSEESVLSSGIVVEIDRAAPTILGAPFMIDFVGSDPSLTFTQTPRFDVLVDSGATVSLWEGTTFLGSGVSSQGFATVSVSTPLAEGGHTVFATALDPAGNSSNASPALTITVDSTAPIASKPDLLDADDDGSSSTDNVTKQPRPRFTVTSEAGARVTIYEDGIGLGSALADATGLATVRVTDVNWFEPGEHCVYALAIDALGNSSAESGQLCVTIQEGAAPFASNLGVDLGAEFLSLSLRSTVSARAAIRILHKGKRVKTITRKLTAKKRKAVRVRLSKKMMRTGKLRVLVSFKSRDGRKIVIKRRARR